MAALKAKQKRAFLRSVARSVGIGVSGAATTVSLWDALNAYQDKRCSAFTTNGVISGTSGNGKSVSFDTSSRGIAPSDFVDLSEDLLTIYEEVRAALVAAGTTSPSDEQILSGMLNHDGLDACTFVRSDFSMLRAGL